MHHVQGQERDQLTLFPEALDDYIAKENPVRFVDAYVDGLDLKGLGFRHALLEETGRPPYHPADLLKLYVYGYLKARAAGGDRPAALSPGRPAQALRLRLPQSDTIEPAAGEGSRPQSGDDVVAQASHPGL